MPLVCLPAHFYVLAELNCSDEKLNMEECFAYSLFGRILCHHVMYEEFNQENW